MNTTLPGRRRDAAWWAVAVGLSLLIPILLWKTDLRIARNSFGDPNWKWAQKFELFGMCGCVSLLLACWTAYLRVGADNWRRWLPSLMGLLVGCHALLFVSDAPLTGGDYGFYEKAARNVAAGLSPYEGTGYRFYLPFTAQALAVTRHGIDGMARFARIQLTGDQAWGMVWYLFACANWWLAVAAFWLLRRLARTLRVHEPAASVAACALLVFSVPLARTLRFGQVNLWVLDLSILAMLWSATRPAASGVALALAGHIKTYPLALAFPLILGRKFAAVACTGVAFLCVVLLQTRGFTNWETYTQFLGQKPWFESPLYDNSLNGFVYNTLGVLGIHDARVGRMAATLALVAIATAWYLYRIVLRAGAVQIATHPGAKNRERLVMMAETLGFLLIVSPVSWEHQYLLALPTCIAAIARADRRHLFRVALGTILISCPTVFSLYPLSYHRLAGLFLVLSSFPPSNQNPSHR